MATSSKQQQFHLDFFFSFYSFHLFFLQPSYFIVYQKIKQVPMPGLFNRRVCHGCFELWDV